MSTRIPIFQKKKAKNNLTNSCESLTQNLSKRQYKKSASPLSNLAPNAKSYFYKHLPFTPQYLKLKQQAFQKYQQIRSKNRQIKQLFTQQNSNQRQINAKKLHCQSMQNNLNMIDIKYPCIGYYQLKGYKNPQKNNRKNHNYSLHRNQYLTASSQQRKKEYKTVQSNQTPEKKYQFEHSKKTRSIKIISNILSKYNRRKKLSKKKEKQNQQTFSLLNFYEEGEGRTKKPDLHAQNQQSGQKNDSDININSHIQKELVPIFQSTIDASNISNNSSFNYASQLKTFRKNKVDIHKKFLLKIVKKDKGKKYNLENQNPLLKQI